MEDKNILTVPEAEITEGSFLFAEVNGELVKTPVNSLPSGGSGDPIEGLPNGAVAISLSDSGDIENDIPQEGEEPLLNADLFGGKPPEYYKSSGIINVINQPVKTGDIWINGKPIWRYVFELDMTNMTGSFTQPIFSEMPDAVLPSSNVFISTRSISESMWPAYSDQEWWPPVYMNENLFWRYAFKTITQSMEDMFVLDLVRTGNFATSYKFLMVTLDYTRLQDQAVTKKKLT